MSTDWPVKTLTSLAKHKISRGRELIKTGQRPLFPNPLVPPPGTEVNYGVSFLASTSCAFGTCELVPADL